MFDSSKATLVAFFAIGVIAVGGPAHAAHRRTWVASFGDDSNAQCTRTTPCRTLQGAISKTSVAGEITCVDGAPYGNIYISGSLTINCQNADGTSGDINAPGDSNLTISASANDKVIVIGLDISLSGDTCCSTVNISGAGTVILHKMKLTNATGAGRNGILFAPTGAGRLVVSESLIANNGNGTGAGIRIVPSGAGSAQVSLERLIVSGNAFGIAFDGNSSTGGINGTIRESEMSSNANDGVIAVTSPSGAPTSVTVINSASLNNGVGIRSIGVNGTVRAEGSKIIGNSTGLTGGGALLSGGGNTEQANGTNGSFTGSYTQQ